MLTELLFLQSPLLYYYVDEPPNNNAGLLAANQIGGGRSELGENGRQYGTDEDEDDDEEEDDSSDDDDEEDDDDNDEEEDDDEDDDEEQDKDKDQDRDDLLNDQDEDDFSADDADILPPSSRRTKSPNHASKPSSPRKRHPISYHNQHLLEDDEVEEDRLDHVMESIDELDDFDDRLRDERWSDGDGLDLERDNGNGGGGARRAETGFEGDDAFVDDEQGREDDGFLRDDAVGGDGVQEEGRLIEESEGGAEGVVEELEKRDEGSFPSGKF